MIHINSRKKGFQLLRDNRNLFNIFETVSGLCYLKDYAQRCYNLRNRSCLHVFHFGLRG